MQLWGGRFNAATNDLMKQFQDSFRFDVRLYSVDIRGSKAYANAILQAGLLTDDEHRAILSGLDQVHHEFETGSFEALPSDEDIHTAVERRLTEIIGAAGGKLHTGRSRNDQVALDLRLWTMEQIDAICGLLLHLQLAIMEKAEAHLDLIMPGYTHLQPAQPVSFSHWLMAYFWMLERDQERLGDCRKRAAVCPLGSGALAGNPFNIDRESLADELGMGLISANSMDAVSDRDYVVEFLSAAALIGVHLSRLAEDLILYSGPNFRFVTLGEEFTTGSSLMPQKRNPDALELTRGKSGRLIGALTSLLVTLKGLPMTYNKDLQEDKEPLFDAVDTLQVMLPIVEGVIQSIQPNPDAMRAALDPAILATDLADLLVDRGIPFREAHGIVGRLVRHAEERGVNLADLPVEAFQSECAELGDDVKAVFNFERSVARRSSVGGTAPDAVREQLTAAHRKMTMRDGK